MESKFDCLILNAPNVPRSEQSILIEPVDALTIATYVQHFGYSSAFIDLDRFGLAPLKAETRRFSLGVLVYDYYIPLHTASAAKIFIDIFLKLREVSEFILIVGKVSSYLPKNMLSKFPELYGCVIGEAEPVIVDILKSGNISNSLNSHSSIVSRKNDETPSSPPRQKHVPNIYEMIPKSGPIANRALCRIHDYIDVHSIISSRGCSGACKFCSTPQYWGPWRGASPELVLAEINHLKSFDINKIIFLDDSFSDDPERVSAICELIKRRRIDFVWGCLCRIEDVSKDLLFDMASTGCKWIHFGIEHGVKDVRMSIGKRFTNRRILEIIGLAKSFGIRLRTSWILDLPGATPDTVRETFKFIKELGTQETKLHFLAVRPGSFFYREKNKEHSFKSKHYGLLDEISIHTGRPNNKVNDNNKKIVELLSKFRLEMAEQGYQWVDNVKFWRRFNDCDASPDERFLSTVVTRYGLGWS